MDLKWSPCTAKYSLFSRAEAVNYLCNLNRDKMLHTYIYIYVYKLTEITNTHLSTLK